MPRPKPKRVSPSFFTHPKSLDNDTRNCLLAILGFSRETLNAAEIPGYRVLRRTPGAPLLVQKVADYVPLPKDPYQAMRLVELALALGAEGAEHLDNIPRPADYREEFDRLRRAVIPVVQLVTNWSTYYRDQFTVRGHDIHAIEQALAKLFDVSVEVIRETKGKSSKGARKQTALTHAIQQLRHTFRDYYQGDPKKAKTAEAAFIRTALEAGRLIAVGYEGLSKLMRDPRCALAD